MALSTKRPDLTEENVQKLASYGCTGKQIAAYFGCSESSINHKFAESWKLGRAILQKNILMWQVRSAHKGSDKMLIHLGKAYCEQSEKIEMTQIDKPQIKVISFPEKQAAKQEERTDERFDPGT